MSTDYAVICDKCRLQRHIGQRFTSGYSFGYGTNDHEGQAKAAEFAFDHAADCGETRIIHSDGVPDEYRDLDLADEEAEPAR